MSLDEKHLNNEKLQNMQLLLPKPDELNKMKQCKGQQNLGQAELFFLSVMKVPQFPQKLSAFKFYLQFDETSQSLKSSLSLLATACDEVTSCKKLAGILRRLLAIGNIMNESAGKPIAGGITLDSLIKTARKKGSDGKTTVLDHLVATSMNESLDIVDFWADMPAVRDAMRLDLDDFRSLLRECKSGVQSVGCSVETEKTQMTNTERSHMSVASEKFIHNLIPFLKQAHMKIENVANLFGDVEGKVQSLCSFFAEDCKTCKVSYIEFDTLGCWFPCTCLIFVVSVIKPMRCPTKKGKHNICCFARFLSPCGQIERAVSQEREVCKAKRVHRKEESKGPTQFIM